MCGHAYCPHCCDERHHHPDPGFDYTVRVGLDVAGLPTFPTATEEDYLVADMVSAQDYATRHPREAFCLGCGTAFSAAICSHHHLECGPDAVVRIGEHGGRHCVRCTGSEWWFPYLDSVLGDPVNEDDERGQQLLPVLTTQSGRCAHCAAELVEEFSSHCSMPCVESRRSDIARRRQRRESRQAARAGELANKLGDASV